MVVVMNLQDTRAFMSGLITGRAAGAKPAVSTDSPIAASEWTAPENRLFRLGVGDWQGYHLAGQSLDELMTEARRWGETLREVKLPWLCWNVDPDWCVLQQRLVREVGWTPVVGFDPRVGPPPLIPGAILMDFNERLRLPTMWLHFPLEFLFLFVRERLAYWHADCLIRMDKMRRYAALFEALADGEMAAVMPREGWRVKLKPKQHRFWEVVGCSTAGASRRQFELGCGWWMNVALHPSASEAERERRQGLHWECGVGIRHWSRKHGGVVRAIPESEIAEGHFTLIGRKDYKRASPVHFKRDLSRELSLNNDLVESCGKLGLSRFLEDDASPQRDIAAEGGN